MCDAARRGRTCSSRSTTRPSFSCTPTASSALPLREKIARLASYQAALAGRDIYYDQRYRHNLEMRDLLEAIAHARRRHRPRRRWPRSRATRSCSGSTPGPYNNLTARKFVLKCSTASA